MKQEKDYLDELIELSRKDPIYLRYDKSEEAAESLAHLRVERGLSQADVAKVMGVRRERVAEIEADPGRVSFSRLALYAAAVGATIAIKKLPASAAKRKPAKSRGRKVGTTRGSSGQTRIVAQPKPQG